MTDAPTWAVVLTANEPLALVETHVRWHLATGARAVYLFVDDPQDTAIDALGHVVGCHLTVCDETHWRSLRGRKGRPPSQMRRQTLNANRAQQVCEADWLFHVDADEFIWQDAPLAHDLVAAPQGHEVNLRPFERLFPRDGQQTLFDGAFRASSDFDADAAQRVYGDDARFMKRGQYSHGAGKSGVRVRTGLRLGVHNATVHDGERGRRAPMTVSTVARLLHFDGLTPLHWVVKLLRYTMTPLEVQSQILHPHRAAQIEWALGRINSMADARAAHAVLFGLTQARRAALTKHDLLEQIPFDPHRVLAGTCPDLDPKAFDHDVLARNPWARDLLP